MRRHREAPIQRAIVQYLRLTYPGAIVHHCRNEINKRGKGIQIELAQAKGLGAMAGFPDLIFIDAGFLCFFEVKAEAGYATQSQKDMHQRLRALGWHVAVVRSIDDVQEAMGEWR